MIFQFESNETSIVLNNAIRFNEFYLASRDSRSESGNFPVEGD